MGNRKTQNKRRVDRSSEKKFIKTMVITGVVGLSIMMITMLYVIKIFGTKKLATGNKSTISAIPLEAESIIVNKTIKGVIHEKTNHQKLKIWDMKESQYIKLQIKDKTQLEDPYGKPMSVEEIQTGDIIGITYEAESKDIVIMQKSADSWTKSDITNIDINPQNNQITIGNTVYDYNSHMIITDEYLEQINISNISEFDTLKVQGINETIWSIQVLQSPGYLKLLHLPSKEGTVEINNNRVYALEEIEDKTPLSQGQHKIVIQIEGYLPFVEQINITQGQVYEIDLGEIEEAVSTLEVHVANATSDYKIHINNKTYEKDDLIRLQPGSYILKLAANGFETFEEKIELEAGDQQVNVSLKAKEKEKPEQTKPEKDEKPDKDKDQEEIKTVQIIIETEPDQAQVFVSGVYKGTTPALTGLKPGEYDISIEKEGYTTLYTTIVIDGANKQKGFLYTLQKE